MENEEVFKSFKESKISRNTQETGREPNGNPSKSWQRQKGKIYRFFKCFHFVLKSFSGLCYYPAPMSNFSVQILRIIGVKTLFFSILFFGLSPQFAFSDDTPKKESIFTIGGITNALDDLLPKIKTWWSQDKSPDELPIRDQIFNQLGSLTLLDLAFLSREEIISKLETDFNISIGTDDSALFNRYFLAYIYSYFEMMFPQPFTSAPLYLHALSGTSPQLVSRDGNNLYFSKNAGDRIINNTFGKFLFDEFSQITELPDEMIVTFEYSNELYDQLNRVVLTNQNIEDFIQTQMGITLKVEATDPLYKNTQPFVREELLILLKQILDMPFHLRDNMALKRIIRMRPDYQPPGAKNPVKADYNPNTQTIRLMDPTFDSLDGNSRGEKTILHEMAHALWLNLSTSLWYSLSLSVQKEYAKLSWRGGIKISDEFISDYSAEDIVEDFAEHVAFYIDNSEKLQKETPGKFQWLKKYIFFNVEYFTDSTSSVKVFVPSELEDSEPPYFVNSPGESVKFFVQGILSDEVRLTAEIEGLFDDISGVESISITLKFKDDTLFIRAYSINKNLCHSPNPRRDCVITDKNRPGWYVIQKKIDRDTIYPGFYTIQNINVYDYAGNSKTFRSQLENEIEGKSRKETVLLPGKRKEKPTPKAIDNEEAIRKTLEENTELIVSKTWNKNTLVHVVIPDFHHPSLGNISSHLEEVKLYLKGVTTEKKLKFNVDMNELPELHSRFNSPKKPGKIVLPVVIPKELVSEQYEVTDIRFKGQAFSNFTIEFERAFFFDHISDQEDRTAPRVRQEDISLKVLKGLNREGGDTSLLATIPVEGFEPGRYVSYHIKIRTPDGTILSNRNWWKMATRHVLKEDENGDQYISAQFDLKPHHLQGEYMLSYISLDEEYLMRIPGLRVYGNKQTTEDRLIERGIRATVHITAPTDVEETELP